MHKSHLWRIAFVTAVMLGVLSCSTVEKEAIERPEEVLPQEEETAPDVKESKAEEPVSITQTIFLLSKEITRFPDNSVDTKIVYSYAPEGRDLVKEDNYEGESLLSESVVYARKEGSIQKRTVTDNLGAVKSYRLIEFDSLGQVISDSSYNKKDQLQSISRYAYDAEGRKIKWSVFNGSEILLSYSTYAYESGRLTKIENFSPSGILEDSFVMEYDAGGHKLFERYLTAGGKQERYTQYRYADGLCVEEVYARAGGSVVRTVKYEYDADGNVRRIRHFDLGTVLREIVDREYIVREVRVLKK